MELVGMTAMVADAELLNVAKHVVWFEDPAQALATPNRFLAYLMTYGTAEHIAVARRHFSESDFAKALAYAPPGIFDRRSWSYWHAMTGTYPPPPLPIRSLSG